MANPLRPTGAGARSRLGRWGAALAHHWTILPLVALFVALGVYYSSAVPIFEVPDEPMHYDYVRRLVEGRGLPPLPDSADDWELGAAHQPPLYHAIGALLTRGVAIDLAKPAYMRNPYTARGDPSAEGNKNAVLHTDAESRPYRGVALAVHILRWFSVACGALTVALSYALALAIAPTRRAIATGAAALVALNPQFIFVSASACSDALAAALISGVLLLCVRVVNGYAHRWRTPIVLGLLAGLAALTHLSGLLVWLLIPAACALAAWRAGARGLTRRTAWVTLAVALGVALAVAGWWYIRNAVLYRDPFGVQALRAAFAPRGEPLSWGETLSAVRGSFVSFWGVFGWMNVLAAEFFYTFVHVLTVLGAVGSVLAIVRAHWRAGSLRQHRWPALALLIGWIGFMLLALALWTRALTGPQGRQMFVAIAPIALLLAAGLLAWLPRHLAPYGVALLVAAMATVSALLPSRAILPAYAQPKHASLEDTPIDMHALDAAFGDELFLLGYNVLDGEVVAGDDLHLRLYWLALQRMPADYTFFVHLFGRDGERIGGVDTYPGGGNYPTTQWVPGEVIVEEYSIPVRADAATPVAARIRVGAYAGTSANPLPVRDAGGQALGRNVEISRVRVALPGAAALAPSIPLQANYENSVRLEGYDLQRDGTARGDEWMVTLYWTALERPLYDYTVFVHLVDQAGQIVDQADAPPLGGDLPTLFWRVGDRVADTHTLTLSQALLPADYTLQVGLYRLETNERLLVVDQAALADHVTIGPLAVGGSR